MGKSVLLSPTSSRELRSAQMSMLKDQLGPGPKLEGPFSANGQVDSIANHVRSRIRSVGGDPLVTTVHTLIPQDLLPNTCQTSDLGIPFILSGRPSQCPESAGDTASARTAAFRGGEARPAGIAALTMLAVAVLRRLDVECHFALYNFGAHPFDETLSDLGIGFVIQTMPVVIAPDASQTRIEALLPSHLKSFLRFPPQSYEALDPDALLSLIKIQNAYDQAVSLMNEIARRSDGSERMVSSIRRPMETGHSFHEGVSAWTADEAMESGLRSRGFFGSDEPRSVRLEMEESVVHTMRCPACHTVAASTLMLPEDTSNEVSRQAGEAGHENTARILERVTEYPQLGPVREYLDSYSVMSDHLHPAGKCRTGKGSN